MNNITYDVLDSFKRVSESFKRFAGIDNDNLRTYCYYYDAKLNLINSHNSIVRYQFIAFKRDTSTKWKDVLFDYTALVDSYIRNNSSQSVIENNFSCVVPSTFAKELLIEDYSSETIQEIIDKNIAALNSLQNYVNDLQLIKDLHLDD